MIMKKTVTIGKRIDTILSSSKYMVQQKTATIFALMIVITNYAYTNIFSHLFQVIILLELFVFYVQTEIRLQIFNTI